jgi:hypothetical protein
VHALNDLSCDSSGIRGGSGACGAIRKISVVLPFGALQNGPERKKVALNPAKPILGPEVSAILREELVGELRAIASPDDPPFGHIDS